MPDPEDFFLPEPRASVLTPPSLWAGAAQRFFAAAAGIAVLGAVTAVFLPAALGSDRRAVVVALLLAFAGAALIATRVPPRRAPAAVTALALAALVVVAACALLVGWGIAAPSIGMFGLLVVATTVLCSWRAGAVVALASAAAVGGLAAAELAGWLAQPPRPPDLLALNAGVLLLVLGAGLTCGLVLARMLAAHVAAADERERRFRRLLAIASDVYWEIDDQYRVVALMRQDNGSVAGDGGADDAAEEAVGHLPWSLPQFQMEPEPLDQLQADLDARVSFRDAPVRWLTSDGGARCFAVSGEPRIDGRGVFRGYWGVARDVTADVSARAALAATEDRYQDLFEHMPTPLVLHRHGRVIDANPAAQALFGHDDGMVGFDLLTLFEPGDSRERARRRIDELERMPVGQALPVTDFRLRTRGGRRVAVRGTGVRVDAEDGLATLTIMVDDTDRRAAEDAVRRSETMLSHLVATNPDVIMLTEMASGRYAMVNRTFERLTGYPAAEVVGRTSVDVGIWHRAEQRAEFVALIQRDGQVQDLPVDFRTKDGRLLSMLVSAARFLMDRREYLVINARDVTASERERMERKAILDTASVGIALTRERRFVMANPCCERMLGWPEGGLRSEPGRVVWADDDDYEAVGALVGPALSRGEVVVFERAMQRRDGSVFVARVTANAIDPRRPAEGGTVWIFEDVTGQRQAADALARARDEAEAANRAKSAFLANTSHELRTPLNAMIGLARLAREPSLDPARRQLYLEQIGDSAESLAAIISDILDLSKIESGKLALESAPFDLVELLRKLHLGYTMLADARGLKLLLEIDPGVEGAVRGDALRVRQILSNYLTNALKFTEAGEVRLQVRRVGGGHLPERVRFEVRDTGPGIDVQTQARLFRPFTQADESTTRRFGGTGLGLSICRELAALMGGQVGVESMPGRGACFWAELPLPPEQPGHHPGPAAEPDLCGLSVLLVEDNAVNMLIAAAMLEQWGVRVTQASDGRQAVAAVARAAEDGQPFDVVLMDVQMPHMSGYEATRVLRSRADGDGLPIIALTAAALVSERDEAFAAGMNDFLTKPIDADRLRATLARWVGQRQSTGA
jgi:PAS domain S-box-containing protein